jgi:transposase-like protein
MSRTKPPYPPEFRREAVELARSSGKPIAQVARDLRVSSQTLHTWIKQADVDAGKREGLSTEEREELRRLRRENRTLVQERENPEKSRGLLRPGERGAATDAYRFIAAEKANYPVSLMSRVLGVNRTTFHRWEGRAPSQRALKDAFLTERIRKVHGDKRGVYGSPRIHAELRMAHEIRVSEKRVERLMRQAGISGLIEKKRGRTTIRVPGVSLAFGQQARNAGIAMSMGSKGDCFDDAVAESFFATLKKELVHRRSWPTRQKLRSAVFDYIESFYNRERRHSTLGYLSPREFEEIYIDKDSEEETVKP